MLSTEDMVEVDARIDDDPNGLNGFSGAGFVIYGDASAPIACDHNGRHHTAPR